MKPFCLTLLGIMMTAQLSLADPRASRLSVNSPTNPDALNCQLALAQNTISLGEPIVLHAKITNQLERNIDVFMGEDHQGWFTVSLRDSAGKNIPVRPMPAPMPSALGRWGPGLEPGASYQEDFVVSNMVRPTLPGQYYMTLYVHLPTSWAANADAYENSYTLPLTITPADPQKLQSVAAALQEAILTEPDLETRNIDIDALFSMPETAVAATWRSLATDTSLDLNSASEAAWQIEQVGSTGACDLLEVMAQTDPPRWSHTNQSPFQDLITLRRTSNPTMQSYIDVILQKLGGNFSKRLLVQGDIN